MKARKRTAHSCIDSRGLARVCLCTSQPWKAVLSLKVEAIQYAIIWIIDDWFLSNQCPHKTMHSPSLPWWRERARPVFVPVPLAKGKSFNALKPLEMLQLKDSPWNQLGWCVFPYEGGLSEWPSSKWGRETQTWVCACTFRCKCTSKCVFVLSDLYSDMNKVVCAPEQERFLMY